MPTMMYVCIVLVVASPALCMLASRAVRGVRARAYLNRCLEKHRQFESEMLRESPNALR